MMIKTSQQLSTILVLGLGLSSPSLASSTGAQPAGLTTILRSPIGAEPNIEGRPLSAVSTKRSPAFGTAAKSVAAGSLLAVPWFEVDTLDPSGRTTLIALRNEGNAATSATVTYYSADGSQNYAEVLTLNPKQTRTRNFRDVVPGRLTPDIDGLIRGWARVQASGGQPLSHDIFYVDPAGNFAGGEVLANPTDGDLCAAVRGRFLIGGGFSGGTRLLVFVDLPLGGNSGTDSPTLTGTAYSEAGVALNNFSVWTDNYALEIDTADLVSGATAFGSLDLIFESADIALGGTVLLQASAEGRYSVTWRGTCLP